MHTYIYTCIHTYIHAAFERLKSKVISQDTRLKWKEDSIRKKVHELYGFSKEGTGYIYMHTCIYTYMHTYIHTCIYTYMQIHISGGEVFS